MAGLSLVNSGEYTEGTVVGKNLCGLITVDYRTVIRGWDNYWEVQWWEGPL